ncbi:unnamed protein product, partial [Candidula unifasciata]
VMAQLPQDYLNACDAAQCREAYSGRAYQTGATCREQQYYDECLLRTAGTVGTITNDAQFQEFLSRVPIARLPYCPKDFIAISQLLTGDLLMSIREVLTRQGSET